MIKHHDFLSKNGSANLKNFIVCHFDYLYIGVWTFICLDEQKAWNHINKAAEYQGIISQ